MSAEMAAGLGAMLADVPSEMGTIFLAMLVALLTTGQLLQRRADRKTGHWLPGPEAPGKRAYEVFAAWYSPFWMGVFGVVIALQMYEDFRETEYLALCGALALPLFLQPLLFPGKADGSLPLRQRYGVKANLWLWVYSFIGNYWYTHYFYNVLRAEYTFPSWRLNHVPFALFFATHFYFSSYHVLSNTILSGEEDGGVEEEGSGGGGERAPW
eukprot:scaffold30_cov255-Pinguiococcus_pyrenoidosus.AAC.8